MACGGYGSINKFLSKNKKDLVNQLKEFVEYNNFEVDEKQIFAWNDCCNFLEKIFDQLSEKSKNVYLAFEYLLPFEGGRRPDVLLFIKDKIFILEFKNKINYEPSDIEQAIGYREDIKNFHEQTYKNNLEVISYLVLTKKDAKYTEDRGVKILTEDNFLQVISLDMEEAMAEKKVKEWLKSKYEPLPSVIEATLRLFKQGNLPYIKNIQEGELEETIKFIKRLINNNETKDKCKNIVFVSGVPGSGKTLVALKTLYDYNLYKYNTYKEKLSAIYLSGNGPLVSVLQEQLTNVKVNESIGKTYIKEVIKFKKEYLNNRIIPPYNVIMFDEAQRAWDKEQMGRYNISEPEGLLSVGNKIYNEKENINIVCFIGDGQVIHVGEEVGIDLWIEALKKFNDWNVYIPTNYKKEFSSIPNAIEKKELYLDTSIRNNFIDISEFIEAILDGNVNVAKKELDKLKEQGYILRISRNYEACKAFLNKKVKEQSNITYGILLSSKANSIKAKEYLNNRGFSNYIKNSEAGNWFLNESKNLQKGASEFVCQGLEIDYPLVCFTGEYYFYKMKWCIDESTFDENDNKFKDFEAIMQNIYRVLLSRSRKGMILYIPETIILDETYELFKEIGADEIIIK
ncbi:DNA/RNA helicase domain-containing protein [Tepidibacter hydrothermalis]|uniref:DUF2075 domain-containing protein n=1 Tax=Tepidibacter hydrothermalis TaxID=3036126 RepID=A0ABY8EA07_9FIRM|nr:DNA/RNA helicase domain-containing protein [Tepidibacter hydrothermalis]WFD09738.1 DUF2075 domain-containing protein [Tepidibacter hydrothermalis]